MTEKTEPTAEGRRRYAPDGRYEDDYPCTCEPDCPPACRGDDCGCCACRAAYAEFASMPDD